MPWCTKPSVAIIKTKNKIYLALASETIWRLLWVFHRRVILTKFKCIINSHSRYIENVKRRSIVSKMEWIEYEYQYYCLQSSARFSRISSDSRFQYWDILNKCWFFMNNKQLSHKISIRPNLTSFAWMSTSCCILPWLVLNPPRSIKRASRLIS